MAVLEAAGYRCTRSAASLGEWNIVAISSRDNAARSSEDERLTGNRRDGDLARVSGAAELPEDHTPLAGSTTAAGCEGAMKRQLNWSRARAANQPSKSKAARYDRDNATVANIILADTTKHSNFQVSWAQAFQRRRRAGRSLMGDAPDQRRHNS